MQINFYQGIQRGLEDRSVACMLPLMHDDIRKMRAIKDAEEIELMRHAHSDYRRRLPAYARLY